MRKPTPDTIDELGREHYIFKAGKMINFLRSEMNDLEKRGFVITKVSQIWKMMKMSI